MAFGTDVALVSVAASVNVFATSRRPETSIPAVGASHAPFTSPFPASVGKPEKSGSSRSEEHTSELQSRGHLVCRLLLEKKKMNQVHFRQVVTVNLVVGRVGAMGP